MSGWVVIGRWVLVGVNRRGEKGGREGGREERRAERHLFRLPLLREVL